MRPVHLALAVLVAAIWGLNFVVIEVGLEDFPPLLLSALRYALASLPLLVLGGLPSVRWRWVLAVGVAIGVVKFSLLFIGMDVGMPAGLASLVLQAQALFTVVLAALLLHERIAGSQMLGLAVAFGGLALVAGGLDGVATAEGFALVIAAALAWGFGNLALKRAAPADPLRFMTTVCVVPPLPLLALSLAFEGPAEIGDAFAGADLRGVVAVLYLAISAPHSPQPTVVAAVLAAGPGLRALLRRAAAGRGGHGPRSRRRRPDPRGRAADAAGPAAGDFSARCEFPAGGDLHSRARHERVTADAEVRDAESEATEVRGPPP